MNRPSFVRQADRMRWADGLLVNLFVDQSEAPETAGVAGVDAVDHSDAAIRRMLSGELPDSAGTDTRLTALAFAVAHERKVQRVVLDLYVEHLAIEPYKSGLAEVRAVLARAKKEGK